MSLSSQAMHVFSISLFSYALFNSLLVLREIWIYIIFLSELEESWH